MVIIPESEDWKDAWRNLANQVPKKLGSFTKSCCLNFFVQIVRNAKIENSYLSLTIQVQAVTVQIYGKQLRLLETF